MNHMNTKDLDVRITMFPREDEEDGSVVLLGKKSLENWAVHGDIAFAMADAVCTVNKLDAMGIHTMVESIEARHGDDVVVAWRERDGKLHWDYKCPENRGRNG